MSNTTQPKRFTPASSETLLTMLEMLPGAFFVLDETDTIVYANASAQAMLSAPPKALCGNSFWYCAPHLVSTALSQAVQKTRQTRAPTEVEYVSPVTRTWLHVQLAPTVGGLLVQVHQERAAQRQETCSQREDLCADALGSLYARVGLLSPEGILLEINEAPLEDAQIRREEVIGHPFAETLWWSFSPTSQQPLRAAIARASTGETVRFDALIHPREGVYRDLEATIIPHVDADHHIDYLVFTGIDITARKRAETEIQALIDTIPQFVWTGRPNGSHDSFNQRWRDYTGQSTEEAQGKGWLQCIYPEDRQRVLSEWQCAVQTGRVYETEARLRQGTTGEYRWFLTRAMPVRDEAGQIIKWFGTYTDIEEQKRAEQQLKESRESWRMLAETVPQLMWVSGADSLFEYTNQRGHDYLGVALEQIPNSKSDYLQFIHPDDRERNRAHWQHAVETGEMYEHEERLRKAQTGEYRWFLVRALPVRDEAGQITKWFGTCTDIEKQKRAEQQLKESRESLRVLAETVPQLVWTKRPDGLHEYVNQRWCDYTGLTPEQIQSDRWAHLQFIHPDDREGNRAYWQHALDTGDMFEYEQRLRKAQTGEYRWFLVRAIPVRDETGQVVKWFGTSTDIEDQKRIEGALRQSQERVNALMDSNIIGITVANGEQIVDANNAFLRMTGYTYEDLYEGRINWMQMTPPEYLARTLEANQELTTQQSTMSYEKEYICQDGSRLPVLVGLVALPHHPHQSIGFVLDNSARKELEQRKDVFICMASHELRNPLTALKLQTTLLHRQLARQGLQAAAPALSNMETQTNKLTRLVEELLDVSKMQTGSLEYVRETVDLDALLREIADTMQQAHPSHTIVVRGTVEASLTGDPDRLGQVFTNLLSNAIKYAPDAETVEMDLFTSEDTVTVRVRDHGLGIPREQRNKIFERFYRVTDPRRKAIPGLGMGLYIVAEIVKRHGGTITVDSEVGTGSTFTVTLPRKCDA